MSARLRRTICAGSSIDIQILTDLFSNFLQARALLGVDQEFAKKVLDTRARLVPSQVGKDGSLQEWTEDWEQLEANHRHFSHLYGLYPGNVLSLTKTPQFMNACKAVLEQRGDGGAGWSRAWKVALWARLHDGNRAEKIWKGYLKEQAYPQLFAKCFTPLQVDGTLGLTAGITELLIQSHEGVLELLPALPDDWAEGIFKGVCARGGFELDLEWKEHKLTSVRILSKSGEVCRIFSPKMNMKVTQSGRNIPIKRKREVLEFQTDPGASYLISIR